MVKKKTELLYGFHPVNEAVKAARRKIYRLFLAKDKADGRYAHLTEQAVSRNIPVEAVKLSQLQHMAGTDAHQGIGAEAGPYPTASIAELIDRPNALHSASFILMLDNVLDPQNLGAMIRTALCVGVDGVIVPKDRSASSTPAVSKASAGALEHVKLVRVTNMVNTIKLLKDNGLWIAGMDRAAEQTLYESDLSGPLAVIIGGEEKGIRPLVRKQCDFLISIPQIGRFDSLNASVAGAVVLYESYRQRCIPKIRKS